MTISCSSTTFVGESCAADVVVTEKGSPQKFYVTTTSHKATKWQRSAHAYRGKLHTWITL